MGIVNFSPPLFRLPALSVLIAPINALFSAFLPTQTVRSGAHQPARAEPACRALGRTGTARKYPPYSGPKVAAVRCTALTARPPPVSRLKVVREFEVGVSLSCAGRMAISGSMAEVCAELDRMAKGESGPQQL